MTATDATLPYLERMISQSSASAAPKRVHGIQRVFPFPASDPGFTLSCLCLSSNVIKQPCISPRSSSSIAQPPTSVSGFFFSHCRQLCLSRLLSPYVLSLISKNVYILTGKACLKQSKYTWRSMSPNFRSRSYSVLLPVYWAKE